VGASVFEGSEFSLDYQSRRDLECSTNLPDDGHRCCLEWLIRLFKLSGVSRFVGEQLLYAGGWQRPTLPRPSVTGRSKPTQK